VGCCYAAGAFSIWSVLGLLLGNDLFLGNDNNGVVFSVGSVPRWYFLWGPFRGYISLLASGGCYWKRGKSAVMSFQKYPSNAVIYLASQP
jgi:hypothetical protein